MFLAENNNLRMINNNNVSDVSRGILISVYRYGRPNYRRPNNCQVKKKNGP